MSDRGPQVKVASSLALIMAQINWRISQASTPSNFHCITQPWTAYTSRERLEALYFHPAPEGIASRMKICLICRRQGRNQDPQTKPLLYNLTVRAYLSNLTAPEQAAIGAACTHARARLLCLYNCGTRQLFGTKRTVYNRVIE